MGNKNIIGKCHLCGETGSLTYEHIPPENCFNNKKNRVYNGVDLLGATNETGFYPWEIEELESEHKLKHEQKQRGVGWYTLCKKCNNSTGSWYAKSFGDFIKQAYVGLNNFGFNNIVNENVYSLEFNNIFPLKILKQILVMFCSINDGGFSDHHINIRNLLLNTECADVDLEKYALNIYISRGKLVKYLGVSGILNTHTNQTLVVSELTTLPFGFVLVFNPSKDLQKNEFNILPLFIKYKFKDKVNLKISIPAYEINTCFPLDYRTKDTIKENRSK